jgi:hypothetical protein
MKRIRDVLRRHPLATALGAGVLAAVIGWGVYRGVAPAPPHAPSPTATGSPQARSGGESPAAPPPAPAARASVPSAGGRAAPFLPPRGAGEGKTLSPVPSPSPESSVPPVPPQEPMRALRLVGIVAHGGALAIVEDETGAYVVGPGDEIGPEVQVVRIDLGQGTVDIERRGAHEELHLPPADMP